LLSSFLGIENNPNPMFLISLLFSINEYGLNAVAKENKPVFLIKASLFMIPIL
jgi:hypothetical protein